MNMRKLMAAMIMTLDGFFHNVSMSEVDDIDEHYRELIDGAGLFLCGSVTYQLMEYWRTVLENPTGNKAADDFAVSMDRVPKIVYSRTLESVDWETATLKKDLIKEEIIELKQQE